MMIKAIIVEDEPASQEVLKKYVEDYPQLKLIAVCENAMDALEELDRSEVDLMFLDIQMPGLNGIQFYKSLTNPPMVIFTTAYAEYAVEGFELEAVDYLLKPFPFERFLKAVAKVKSQLKSDQQELPEFLLIKADKKLHKVYPKDIQYVESLGDYIKIHKKDGTLIVHETLQSFLSKLPAHQFCRVHKSYVINLASLDLVDGNQVKLQNQVLLPIGKSFRKNFMEKIELSS